MAEYIDRKGLMNDLSPIVYKDGYIANTTASKIVYEIQCRNPADVIERSKIDEAIKETYKIRKEVLNSNETYEVNDVLDIIDEISALFERI